MSSAKPIRVLAFDTSMTCPGVAIIEVRNRKPTIKALSHVKPNPSRSHAHRAEVIEGWAMMFLDKNCPRDGFDYVVREDFAGKTSISNYPVLSAWNACERAASRFGLTFDKFRKPGKRTPDLGIPATTVKSMVAGSGKAEKDELQAAVRRMTGYKGEFANFDESDAAAIGLAWLIHEGLIDKPKEGVK
ncbi:MULTISPECIES: hypothetical protein [Bacillus]|uniref:Holliday junction nuclease RuvC n=1 Tax=Bacillus glycinifermentans TaxID=1664069 RepID=A0AAJ3YX44_9BACI|nr:MULTISPECIES: hypothetical protein [Bacillus]MDU0071709.1 hypothetical protein [Bacillus sp. IG6]MED8021310.1 hypothetical protein [Bacillus glycinifermentans]QAT64688.1 hypothetical protein EQZ20_07075 [Bacillus glycinifermentans]